MQSVIAILHLRPDEADLRGAARKLGVPENEIDAEYGVIPVDPPGDRYTVLLPRELGEAACREGKVEIYSNPRIATFGPPQPRRP